MTDQELTDVCREYFEISIGYRKPSNSERATAQELWLKRMISSRKYTPIDFIKMIKYPLEFESSIFNLYSTDNPKLWVLSLEIYIYKILSKVTSIIEGPFIPMLRYEIRVQQSLFQENMLIFAILRQRALLETIFREKAGLGQVDWKWTLESTYRGENIIGVEAYDILKEHTEWRNDFAHDWFSYIHLNKNEVRSIARKGLRILSYLLSKELYETFQSYCSKHPSQRHFAKLEQRPTAVGSSFARPSVRILCDNCGCKFDPQNHWKRCPDCYSWHGYWEE